ncbi:sensor histidine kinase [Kitasatospora sp. NPDC058170]|uniref:sensor histidine kinase n=1 Tax=Kitasatospora sp. NPDC058170 TaxID=3346364 RepID=UPI0036D9B8A2
MKEAMPRPPLLGRIPPRAWPMLGWCAATVFALMFHDSRPHDPLPGNSWLGWAVHLDVGLWAVLSVLAALPILLWRRRPQLALGLMLAESVLFMGVGRSWLLLLLATDTLVLYLAAGAPRPPVPGGRAGGSPAGGPGPAAGVEAQGQGDGGAGADPEPSRRAAAGAAAVTLAAQLAEWRATNGSWAHGLLAAAVPIAAGVVIAWLVGHSVRQRRHYAESLRIQAAAQAAERAVQAERLRIARELHDMVAHSIGVIAFQAGAAGRVFDTQPEGARQALTAIELTSRETLAGLRRMLGVLRRADADWHGEHGEHGRGSGYGHGRAGQEEYAGAGPGSPAAGLADLERLTATTAAAGVDIDVRTLGQPRPLRPEIDLSAFRIIQESVTNVVRHAAARRCRVLVEYRSEELAIEITDDGPDDGPVGRSVAPTSSAPSAGQAGRRLGSGYGIAGMRERVGLLNGRFSAGPRPEGGFRVMARLPG